MGVRAQSTSRIVVTHAQHGSIGIVVPTASCTIDVLSRSHSFLGRLVFTMWPLDEVSVEPKRHRMPGAPPERSVSMEYAAQPRSLCMTKNVAYNSML